MKAPLTLRKRILLIVFLVASVIPSMAQKNDTLRLMNDDRIIGEIKKLEFGVLTYKTDDMGTLSIDWRKVKSLKSTNSFEIVMSNGMIYYAQFDTTNQKGKIRLVMQMATNTVYNDVEKQRIVIITRIKQIFWSRFDGSINLALGLQKANALKKFSVNGNTNYRDRKYFSQFSFRVDRSVTGEEGSLSTNQNINLSVYRQITGKWFFGISGTAEQNTQLGLDLRGVIAANVGGQIIHTNRHSLLTIVGLQGTREWSADSLQSNHLEGKFGVQYRLFNFQDPKISLNTNALLFPEFTNWGRIRTDIDIGASIEIFKDFIFGVSMYHKFDSRPVTAVASSIDWSFDVSVGYTF
jgi:hypothetical protein